MVIDNETAMQPLGDDSRAPLKIRCDVSGDIAQNFAILSDIYNRLYTWDLMMSREIQAPTLVVRGEHDPKPLWRIVIRLNCTDKPCISYARKCQWSSAFIMHISMTVYEGVSGAATKLMMMSKRDCPKKSQIKLPIMPNLKRHLRASVE